MYLIYYAELCICFFAISTPVSLQGGTFWLTSRHLIWQFCVMALRTFRSTVDELMGDAADARMHECAPTEIDTSSVTEIETSDASSPKHFWRQRPDVEVPNVYDDDLLDRLAFAMQQPDRPPRSPSSFESFDSEATKGEDPYFADDDCASPSPPIDAPLHWSVEPAFVKSVNDLLMECQSKLWYEGAIKILKLGCVLDFEQALLHSINFIRVVQSMGVTYKIGITCSPLHRFEGDTDHAYIRDKNAFQNMKLLWFALKSSKHLPETSGRMEVKLVEVFNSDTCSCCINRPGSGGECPSRSSPNFTYVVW